MSVGSGQPHPRTLREVSETLGPEPSWAPYDRSRNTPLSAVLDYVAGSLQREPVLIWVNGGSPAVLALTGLPDPVAIWSTRHLELSGTLRELVVDRRLEERMRRELARRTILTVVAELALRMGARDAAARSVLLAIGGDVVRPQVTVAMDLEPSAQDEAYVTLWSFAIAHEFGHHVPAGADPPDSVLTGAVTEAFQRMPALAGESAVIATLLDQVRADPEHRNRPHRLRRELVADGFAVETVIEAAGRIMKAGGRTPRPGFLLHELCLAHYQIGLVERCASMARSLARGEIASWEDLQALAGISIRSQFVLGAAAHLLGDGSERWEAAVGAMVDDISAGVGVVDSGLADAMLAVAQRSSDGQLVSVARLRLRDPMRRALVRQQTTAFSRLARQMVTPADDDLLATVIFDVLELTA